jgi:hypothetical protein
VLGVWKIEEEMLNMKDNVDILIKSKGEGENARQICHFDAHNFTNIMALCVREYEKS